MGGVDLGGDRRERGVSLPPAVPDRPRGERGLGDAGAGERPPGRAAPRGARATACCSSSRWGCARRRPLASGHDLRRIARARAGLRPRRARGRAAALRALAGRCRSPARARCASSRCASWRGAPRARRAGSASSAPVLWAFLPTALPLAERLDPRPRRLPLRRPLRGEPRRRRRPSSTPSRGACWRGPTSSSRPAPCSPSACARRGGARCAGAERRRRRALRAGARAAARAARSCAGCRGRARSTSGNLAAYRVDLALLAALARGGVSLVLVGPIGLGDARARAPRRSPSSSRCRGVRAVGPRPPEALPALPPSRDVALMPFLDNDHTRASFPLKLWEYLAAGLPVVATPLPNLRELGGARSRRARAGARRVRGGRARAAADGARGAPRAPRSRARARLARAHRGALRGGGRRACFASESP